MSRTSVKIFPFLIISSYFLLQLIFINADTPEFFTTDVGTYCDEGYKTLDARNLVLFGETHWSEYDEYNGWLEKSPVTVGINFIMFKLFGVSIGVARFSNILFAIGTLYIFYTLLKISYDRKVALICTILCGYNQVFFFYSRLALFEVKMLFFMVCAVYFIILSKKNRFFVFPLLISCITAYLCKPTALIFIMAVVFYFILTAKDGVVIKNFFKAKFLLSFLIFGLILLSLLEYNFEYFEHIKIMGRTLRSPIDAFLRLPPPEFFKKTPILVFLSLFYITYMVGRITDDQKYNNEDIFFMVWFLLGIIFHSFLEYRPLRYYVIFVVPMTVLGVLGMLSFSEVLKTLFNGKNRWIKGFMFVISVSFLIIFSSFAFLSTSPFFENLFNFGKRYFPYLVVVSVFFLITVYILFVQIRNVLDRHHHFFSKLVPIILLSMILVVHLTPIYAWVSNPRYDLQEIFYAIDGLGNDVVVAGDWAPQLCINTNCKALYMNFQSKKQYLNFESLRKIKPDFLVVVDGINDADYKEFRLKYPNVSSKTPVLHFMYAGQFIKIYNLDFSSFFEKNDIDSFN